MKAAGFKACSEGFHAVDAWKVIGSSNHQSHLLLKSLEGQIQDGILSGSQFPPG